MQPGLSTPAGNVARGAGKVKPGLRDEKQMGPSTTNLSLILDSNIKAKKN